MHWDIFCRVVDNYGDIGVTWRLARQLVAEHGLRVRLWVDELAALARLCPETDAQAARQMLCGVEVCHWSPVWPGGVAVADLVIEAFACELPEAYVTAMGQRAQPVLWLNLEYLSGEAWVEGCHALPSPQANGVAKFFFFPGFTPATGGLLRETELLARRQAWQAGEFLQRLGVQAALGARLISLFAYENAALPAWLEALAQAPQPSHLLVPEGRILGDVQGWLGGQTLLPGECRQVGQLRIQLLPFLAQDDYDRLLWSCDFNAVRGEDSFVRAQWAARPMLWHIYPQAEDVHLDKLEAFLDRYVAHLPVVQAESLRNMWLAWNGRGDMRHAWEDYLRYWPAHRQHAQDWAAQLARQDDLAAALVQFYRNWL